MGYQSEETMSSFRIKITDNTKMSYFSYFSTGTDLLGSSCSSFDRRAFSVTESFSSNPSAITMGSSCGGCMAIGHTVCDVL